MLVRAAVLLLSYSSISGGGRAAIARKLVSPQKIVRMMTTDATKEIDKSGAFVRTESTFRGRVDAAEKDRYALIVSHACPWANRCTAMRLLKGLDDVIDLHVVHPTWGKTKPDLPEIEDSHCGWQFATGAVSNSKGFGSFELPGCTEPPTFGMDKDIKFVRDLYPDSVKKFTVPILYDKKTQSIVNNESSEVLRILNSDFAVHAKGKFAEYDFYPEALRSEIDAVNDWIYHDINNGVYKAGFAKSQEAYESACDTLFSSLDRVEEILSESRSLVKGAFTEADIRLFMTLARFDEVYVVYFKTNKKFLHEYPNIRGYCRDVYQSFDGIIGQTIFMDHIKTHYFTSHPILNPYAVIPMGPGAEEDFLMPFSERVALP